MEKPDGGRQSAVFSLLGHKGDLMFVHFRRSFEELSQAQLQLARLALSDYLEPTTSYLSMVELGLYESTPTPTRNWRAAISSRTPKSGSAKSKPCWSGTAKPWRRACGPRSPPPRYICFYPMDRRRGESRNWYQEPMADRQRMMKEHGLIGRRYAGEVRQIITGSIGFDDWEWGVDLFAEEPLVFKKLIYEMRFDQVSAVYALFGAFYVGLRVPASGLGGVLRV
jgi:peroxiredoxin